MTHPPIRVKKAVLEAARQLERTEGPRAVSMAESRLAGAERIGDQHGTRFWGAVWRFLMIFETLDAGSPQPEIIVEDEE